VTNDVVRRKIGRAQEHEHANRAGKGFHGGTPQVMYEMVADGAPRCASARPPCGSACRAVS
jgi:hypothetical protein